MGYRIGGYTKGDGLFCTHIRGGEAIPCFSLVYIDGNGQWRLADADTTVSMPVMGLTTESLNANRLGKVLLQGFMNYNGWSWTAGGEIYASTVAGELTQIMPAGIGDVVQVVGIATEATMIYFMGNVDGSHGKPWDKVTEASYIVFTDGTNVYAKNGMTGQIDYSGADAATIIQDTIDVLSTTLGGTIYLREGTYPLNRRLTIQSDNIFLKGSGRSTVLDFTGVAGTGNYLIYAYGEVTATNSLLTVAGAIGDTTVTVANGALFSAGDWIMVRSDAAFNGGAQELGEIQKIRSILGNVFTIERSLLDNYALVDNAAVDLLTVYEGIEFEDFTVVSGDTKNNYGIYAVCLAGMHVRNIHVIDCETGAIYVTNCVDTIITDCEIIRSDRAGYGYGVAINDATRNLMISSCKFENCRHAVVSGGFNGYGVTRGILVDGCSIYSDAGLFVQAFNTHNTVEGGVFNNNIVLNQALCALDGIRVSATGNYCVFGAPYNVAGTLAASKYCSIIGNTIMAKGITTSGTVYATGTGTLIHGNHITTRDAAPGIYVSTFTDLTINENTIIQENAGVNSDAIRVAALNGGEELFIHGNTMVGGYNGVKLRVVTAGNLVNTMISDNKISGGASTGIDIDSVSTGIIIDLFITGNKISDVATGIYGRTNDSQNVTITNNHLKNCSSYGIVLQVGILNYRIMNNKFENCAVIILDQAVGEAYFHETFYKISDPDTFIGTHPAALLGDGSDVTVYEQIMIPRDFQQLMGAHAIIVPGGTGNMRRSAASNWGLIGTENYNTATDTIAAGQVAVTTNKLEAIDINTLFTNIAGGDLVGFTFTREGSNVNDTVGADCYYLGVRIRYI